MAEFAIGANGAIRWRSEGTTKNPIVILSAAKDLMYWGSDKFIGPSLFSG
jgi:hypothetical protein